MAITETEQGLPGGEHENTRQLILQRIADGGYRVDLDPDNVESGCMVVGGILDILGAKRSDVTVYMSPTAATFRPRFDH